MWQTSPFTMDEAPWLPSGIIIDDSEGIDSERIQTALGSIDTWDFIQCVSPEWWEQPPLDGKVWGQWPKGVNPEIIKQDRKGVILRLNEQQIARVSPFAVGNDLSRFVKYDPWRKAVNELDVILPSMVYSCDNNDRVAVYDCSELMLDISNQNSDELAAKLGRIHLALHKFSTPNTERRWNDRLKDIEGELKVTTLWRAPHSKYTVGLPRLNIDLDMLTRKGDQVLFIADVRSLVEQLLCAPDRLPGLANLMLIEQQISFTKGMTQNERKKLLHAYLGTAPHSYSNKKALSTLMGGPWIWRYHAVLLALGEARVYGDEDLDNKANNWLNDVSRIQAHLGVLRLWKSGLWAGIVGVVIAFFAWRMATISPTIAGVSAIFCIIGSLTCNMVYWSKDPKPY